MKVQGILKSVSQTIPLGEIWETARKEGWSFRYQAKGFGLHVL